MQQLRQYIKNILSEEYQVRGYIKPASAFHTLNEWEVLVEGLLQYQENQIDTRSGEIPEEILPLITKYFGFQLYEETPRYDLLTKKNVLNSRVS